MIGHPQQKNLFRSKIFLGLWLFVLKTSSAFGPRSSLFYTGTMTVEAEYIIRDCTLKDLHSASDLATNSFHFNPSSTVRYHQQMDTYARLKSHFPRNDSEKIRHRMLFCALADKPDVAIGFCQLHNRPPLPDPYFTHNPRPMISDLVICSSMRRKGIARKMVDICEFISLYEFNSPTLSLRVVDSNEAARKLYESLGYEYIDCREEKHPEMLVLQKQLSLPKSTTQIINDSMP